jgi:hypothetical protein
MKVVASQAERDRIAREVARMQDLHDDWGFKDPRTCITYPIWNEILPEHTVIGIYRALPEVWAHEAKAHWTSRSLWKTMRMWVDYNRRLADVVEGRIHYGLPTILLSFESLMSGDEELDRLQRFMDRKLADPRRSTRYRSRSRSTRRIKLTGYVMGQLGYCQPTIVMERLNALRREE